jgi:hypothetical protein
LNLRVWGVGIELAEIKEYLTENIKYNSSRRAAMLVQVVERAPDNDEENEKPEESDHLDVSPSKLVDGDESNQAPSDSSE